MNIAEKIASTVAAIRNCERSGNVDWLNKHSAELDRIARNMLPSGSGIDNGTQISEIQSTPDKLVLLTGFRHMNDAGVYAGWTHHVVTVRASLVYGLDIRISGRNRNGIKDYLGELFHHALSQEFPG